MMRPRARRKHSGPAASAVLTLLLVLYGSLDPGDVRAQDFADLSLEELLAQDVFFVHAVGLHTHLQGEWMIGYRYDAMRMEGQLDGTRRLSAQEVLEDFTVSPIDMEMEMHMTQIMYQPSNSVTLMAMLPYHRRTMNHVTRSGSTFRTESQGFGDLTLGGYFTVLGDAVGTPSRVVLAAGISLPTGSIGLRGDTPAGANQPLPYPMQFAAGSPAAISSVAYMGEWSDFAWVTELGANKVLRTNDRGYMASDRFKFTGWGAWALVDWIALTAAFEAAWWSNVDGADRDLNPLTVPTANPDLRAGRRVDLGPGLTIRASQGRSSSVRLAFQVTMPIYQALDGPQLETGHRLTTSLSWTF